VGVWRVVGFLRKVKILDHSEELSVVCPRKLNRKAFTAF
jgi:hypothetical protein